MSMKFWVILLLVVSTACDALGLEINAKMGKPTEEELTMTTYDADPEASAVVLYSETDASFEFHTGIMDFRLVYYKKERVKVLKPEGVEAGNIVLPYLSPEGETSKEFISNLKVNVYNLENGKVVKSKMSSDLQTKDRLDKFLLCQKAAAPNVRVGSVIEYEYKMTSDYYFNPNTWTAQGRYPVFYTKYSIAVPDWFIFSCYPRGMCHLKPSRKEDSFMISGAGLEPISTGSIVHIFEGQELPAIEDCEFVYCVDDYCTRVEHELKSIQIPGQIIRNYNRSWVSVAYSLYKDEAFGERYRMKNPLSEQQKALNLQQDMPVKEKVECLRQLLCDNYKWDGNYSFWGASARAIRNDKDRVLNMGSFDFTFMSMLRDAGIKAHPVVLNRRSNGRLPYYPSTRYLSAMVLRVDLPDSTFFYVDPTAEGYPVGVLPPELLANDGLVIYTDRARLVPLAKSSDGRTNAKVKVRVSEDGTLKGHAEIDYSNQAAGLFRISYRESKDSTEFVQNRAAQEKMTFESYALEHPSDNSEMVTEIFDFSQELQAEEDVLYINPYMLVDSKNPFVDETRILPVEWPFVNTERLAFMFEIPEGYEVESMPRNKKIGFNDNMYVNIKANITNGSIILSFNNVRKDMMVQSDMYSELYRYYGEIESTAKEMIVLRKK